MKIGITFGGYCPLHQGHMDVILRSKKENDLTFVVVCGYEGEKRAESLHLSLSAKTRLIKDFLEDDLVRVISVNDTELGLDESMSPDNWKIWTENVYGKIFKDTFIVSDKYLTEAFTYDFTWYVAESFYKESIEKYSYLKNLKDKFEKSMFTKMYTEKVILMDRCNPISGTKCRENPLKYWNQITKPFRNLLSTNILIAGTASEGKTTLVNDIARYFGIVYSYEKGRDNCKWKTDDMFDAKDFIYNLYEQYKYNNELINSDENTGVFISDTDNMVTLMYAWKYAQRKDFALTQEDYNTLYGIAKIYRASTHWNKIFLLKPHTKPIVDDGERYMPDSDYNIRVEYFEKLKSLYDEFGYEYEILDGTYYENFIKVKSYIRGLYE